MATRHGAAAVSTAETSDWVRAHAALTRLAQERALLDAEEGRWLLCAWRSEAHVHLGHGSFAQYVERLLGYKPRTTQEKLRVAEALEGLPELARALESGALGWCATRELTRVAVPETEAAWLDVARSKTLRELEALVASKAPGDAPDAPANDRPRPRVLRFEVAPDTCATFREAMLQLRRAAGGHLDDDAVLLAMARHVLGGPRDDGRSSYQISLSVCGACGSGAQRGEGELIPVDAAIVEMAKCDAQHIPDLQAANENASMGPDPDGGTDADTGTPEGADVPSGESARPDRSSDRAHVGASRPAAAMPSRPRAKQDIPPALRRAVLTRDQHRCRVPGCSHATFVDVHHLRPRSEGGLDEASNLATLCSAHHRAVHRGELLIETGSDGGLGFRHADGAAYGSAVAPQAVDAHAKVFSALRQLGFREGEVKAVLGELRSDPELRGANAKALLHEALRRIRPARAAGKPA